MRSRPGGPRLDWVLCISYLAIISGVRTWGEKKVSLPVRARSKVSQADQASKQATAHNNTGTRGPRGGGSWALSLSLLKLKNEDPGLPAFAALAAQIVMTAAGWADASRLCLTRFPSDDIASSVCVCDLFPPGLVW